MTAASKIDQLRAIDMQIIQHVLERGKLWQKRRTIIQSLPESEELAGYRCELQEWLNEMSETKGGRQ